MVIDACLTNFWGLTFHLVVLMKTKLYWKNANILSDFKSGSFSSTKTKSYFCYSDNLTIIIQHTCTTTNILQYCNLCSFLILGPFSQKTKQFLFLMITILRNYEYLTDFFIWFVVIELFLKTFLSSNAMMLFHTHIDALIAEFKTSFVLLQICSARITL